MTAAILVVLACLNAIRIAAVGETNANRWSAVDGAISAILARLRGFALEDADFTIFWMAKYLICKE
jgi:hypothetical protein